MKCLYCKKQFNPERSNQSVCSFVCGLNYSRGKVKKEAKEKKQKIKELKESVKTKSDHLNELQKIFNKFIRLRDKDQPCISCGTTANVKYDAGHYISVGSAPALRLNEDNVHKQCSNYCNKNKSGNTIEYRIGLIGRIGVGRVEQLESMRSEPKHYSIEEIKELKKLYKQKIKELEK